MSTRARIALFDNSTHIIHSVYLHYGNPTEVLPVLKAHWQDADKLSRLIALGDLSQLGAELGEQHPFDQHTNHPTWCLAYGRDRGETDIASKSAFCRHALMQQGSDCGASYLYLFSQDYWLSLDFLAENPNVWSPV